MGKEKEYSVKDVLNMEIRPALGCTEPVAIALGTAAASSVLPPGEIDSIDVRLDLNVAKNAFMVTIPGTNGEFGLPLAAALGTTCRNPQRKLELLDDLTEERLVQAKRIVSQDRVNVELLEDVHEVHIHSRVRAQGHVAETFIEGNHDNITAVLLDGEEISGASHNCIRSNGDVPLMEAWLKTLIFDELFGLLDDLDEDDLEFMEAGVLMNNGLAQYGLQHSIGLGVGRALENMVEKGLLNRDMELAASILTAAAADARMGGASLCAMSSAGSGNHGLTATLPLWAAREFIKDIEDRTVLRAIALSHIVTSYVKTHTGRLSPICGCGIAAGAGAAAGIAYMIGGEKEQIAGAVGNMIGDLAGVICDGAKGSCALKLATAAGAAVRSALLAINGVNAGVSDGIVGLSFEGTIDNVGLLCCEGMLQADRTILNILKDKVVSCP